MIEQAHAHDPAHASDHRFPWAGLSALSSAGFITMMTEILPAGLLTPMSTDLGVSEPAMGQAITVYAVGSAVAAIPLTTASMTMRRRPLLLMAIAGFAVANALTALADHYALLLVARLVGGLIAGLVWSLLAGYARRMAAPHLGGRAVAAALAGVPIALVVGMPAGTMLGHAIGWRLAFGLVTALTLILLVWALATVPDFPGHSHARRAPLRLALTLPGVRTVIIVALAFVLAHNMLYTFIAPYLAAAGMAHRLDTILLVFGLASLVSIWATGLLIDRFLRRLTILSCLMFGVSALGLGLLAQSAPLVFLSIIGWGLAFGGAPTLLQTASARAAGAHADAAQSMIVTVWNSAIAGGGAIGGLLLNAQGAAVLPWVCLGLVLPALAITITARRHGFPP